MQLTIMFSILSVIFLGVDLYVFQGFKLLSKKWMPSFANTANIIYWAVPIALTIFIFITMFFWPEARKSKWVMWASTLLIGLFLAKLVWVLFMIFDDVVRLFKFTGSAVPKTPSPNAISRSQFIVTTGAVLAGTMFSSLVYGIAKGAHNYKVFNRKLKLKNLPKAFEGFKIVQISDVHSGSFWNKEAVSKGIQLILDQKPDAIFFTGDLVNNTADEIEGFKDIFSKLEAKYGVYSVLGNHDYGDYVPWPNKDGVTKEQNLDRLKMHHKEMGWDLLINENRVIKKDGEELAVLGVENWSAHMRFPKYGNLRQAYSGVEHIENKLLLSHDPSHWKAEVLPNFPSIDAMFAGHTHGMQFGVDTKYYRWSPVKYQYPEWADLYEENNQYLYVNRGFGYLGYPGRVGFYPEITVFELESA